MRHSNILKILWDCVLFEINKQLIEDFKKKLLSARQLKSTELMLSNNSASSYFVRFLQCLENAYFDNFLSENLKERTDGIKEIETVKEFLTLSECRKLLKHIIQMMILLLIANFHY